MKTFSDLEFRPHALAKCEGHEQAEQAKMVFDNGTEISVIRGSEHFYSGPGTYEVLTTPSLETDNDGNGDVLGWQTAAQITELMKQLQGKK